MSFVPHYNNVATSSALTHPSLHLRDARDAQVILEAVRRNMLPLVKRRLLANEREALVAGNVYVWEEAEDEGGLLRWTDGRRWSQSRMRGDFLFYEEKVETTQEERDAKAARRARRAADPKAILAPPTRRKDRPSKPNGLTKQTYSATVYSPGADRGKKWHVVAYFSPKDYSNLPVIEHYDNLRRLQVPQGVIMTTKTVPLRPDRFVDYSDDEDMSEPLSQPFPTLSSPSSSSLSSPMSPIGDLRLSRIDLDAFHAGLQDPRHISLPSLSSMQLSERPNIPSSPSEGSAPHRAFPTPISSRYAPLTSEDRKALNSFRVVL